MSVTDRWVFKPAFGLQEIISDFYLRSSDWSPAMQRIAVDAEAFVENVVFPSSGEGKWAPTAQSTLERDKYKRRDSGSRKGIIQWTGRLRNVDRDWSPRNAVVMSVWPHAHLQEGGTKRYATPLYQTKGKKKSAVSIKAGIAAGGGSLRVPAREFVYMDEGRMDGIYPEWILEYFFGELAE